MECNRTYPAQLGEINKILESKRKDYAVIIVDLQEDSVKHVISIKKSEDKKLSNIEKLLSKAHELSYPVIFTEDLGLGGLGSTAKRFKKHAPDAIYLEKNYPDAFSEKKFNNLIKKTGAENLIFAGYHQFICVYRTAFTALKKGFSVHVSIDTLVADHLDSDNGAEKVTIIYQGTQVTKTYKDFPIFKKDV